MSNRLEHEFPAVRWQAMPSPGANLTAQARGARRAVIRRGARAGLALLARAAGALVTFIRCGAYGIAKQAPARDDRRCTATGGA